jgi:hypothetical protein
MNHLEQAGFPLLRVRFAPRGGGRKEDLPALLFTPLGDPRPTHGRNILDVPLKSNGLISSISEVETRRRGIEFARIVGEFGLE